MLQPKRTKFRKQFKGRIRGKATSANTLDYGEYGLKALEHGHLTNRQIEAARIAMTRKIKRGGKVWINLFPDKPFTKKPLETRMGTGKGGVEGWMAQILPGRILYEMDGIDEKLCREAFATAGHKLPIATRFVRRADQI